MNDDRQQHPPQFECGFHQISSSWYDALLKTQYPAGILRFVLAVASVCWGREHEHGWCRISDERLAKLLGIGRTAVTTHRKRALAFRLIEVEKRAGGSKGRSLLYFKLTTPEEWLPYQADKTSRDQQAIFVPYVRKTKKE